MKIDLQGHYTILFVFFTDCSLFTLLNNLIYKLPHNSGLIVEKPCNHPGYSIQGLEIDASSEIHGTMRSLHNSCSTPFSKKKKKSSSFSPVLYYSIWQLEDSQTAVVYIKQRNHGNVLQAKSLVMAFSMLFK